MSTNISGDSPLNIELTVTLFVDFELYENTIQILFKNSNACLFPNTKDTFNRYPYLTGLVFVQDFI